MFFGGLAEDVLDALEGGGDGGEVFGAADGGEGLGAGDGVGDVVVSGGESGGDDVVGEVAGLAEVEVEAFAEEAANFPDERREIFWQLRAAAG